MQLLLAACEAATTETSAARRGTSAVALATSKTNARAVAPSSAMRRCDESQATAAMTGCSDAARPCLAWQTVGAVPLGRSRRNARRVPPPDAASHSLAGSHARSPTGPSKPIQSRAPPCTSAPPPSGAERRKMRARLSRQPAATRRPSGEIATLSTAAAPISSEGAKVTVSATARSAAAVALQAPSCEAACIQLIPPYAPTARLVTAQSPSLTPSRSASVEVSAECSPRLQTRGHTR